MHCLLARAARYPLLARAATSSSVSRNKALGIGCEWIGKRFNTCLLGAPGTGKAHLSIALGLAACRQGHRVRFFTAAALVNRLEEAQKQYQLDRLLNQLDRADLLICDELGYLSFTRSGAELLRSLRAAEPADHQQPGL